MKKQEKTFEELLAQFNAARESSAIKCGELADWSIKNEKELASLLDQQIEFISMLSIMFLQEDLELLLLFTHKPELLINLRTHSISVLQLGYKLGYEACQSKKILGDIK